MNTYGLTPRQERWGREYVIDLNGAKAARRAGYSKHSAGDIGAKNIHKPKIARFVQALQSELAERLQVNAQTIVEELARMGLANAADYVKADGTAKGVNELTRDQAAAVIEVRTTKRGSTVTTVLKLADKRGCLGDVGRHLGIFERDNAQLGEAAAKAALANPGANIETARMLAFALALADNEAQSLPDDSQPVRPPSRAN